MIFIGRVIAMFRRPFETAFHWTQGTAAIAAAADQRSTTRISN